MKILWEEHAWEEYCSWQTENKRTLKRINTLVKAIQRIAIQESEKLSL